MKRLNDPDWRVPYDSVIGDPEIPKPVRYAVLALLIGFILFIVIYSMIQSPYLIGKIVCGGIALLMLGMGICLAIRIHYQTDRSKNRRDKTERY